MSYNRQWDEKTLRDLIDRSLNESRNLTDWEKQFLESISDQLDRRGCISDKQAEILDRIYTEKVP